jgi:hypothetical protein
MRSGASGEVVRQGSAAVIVLVPGAGGRYCAAMADGWRVCIALGDLPRSPHSFHQALRPALRNRLGDQADQVAVRSNATHIFLYAPSIDLADEAAQVAREVLNAPVRTEGWDPRKQK